MFTGIIRHRGRLTWSESTRLAIDCPSLRQRLTLGESVAVDGVCLTVASLSDGGFESDLLAETLDSTTLGSLPAEARLNLELPLAAGDTLGGHWVQGHVDGTAELLAVEPRSGGDYALRFGLPEWLRHYAVDRGSICINGVSLTVQDIGENSFGVGIIPVTWNETNLGNIQPGDRVNIEADYLVKTVRHALGSLLPAILADRG